MNKKTITQSMGILGYGLCIQNPELAKSLGFDDVGIDASVLQPMIRRRTSMVTKIAITALTRACKHAKIDTNLPVIFVSSTGEMSVTVQLCEAIASSQLPLSPTLFHNSVHNSTAGYWSMAVKTTQPMMSMAAQNDGFTMGLLEAFGQLDNGCRRVLFVCYDEPIPEQLSSNFQVESYAISFVLSSEIKGISTLSRPYISQVEEPSNPPALDVGISLIQKIENNRYEKQIIPISSGDSSWNINLQNLKQ